VRELIADLFTTLDGHAAGERSPAYFGYLGPELERWIGDELAKPQVILFGRVTYELLARMSEGSSEEGARRMTELPKLVVSGTLEPPLAWSNSELFNGNLADLKAGSGDPLRCMGSLSLVRSLLSLGLVDRLRLMVFPQVLGATGREPFFAGLPDLDLELADERVLDGRLVLLDYRPGKPS
jgi:dihydrofolate reductase